MSSLIFWLLAKPLGCGYAPISALLLGDRVVNGLKQGSGFFIHGQTYQAHTLSCAVALEVQKIIQEDNLVENVRVMGGYLGRLLQQVLGNHPYVGDIRGRGLFWAVEFVADKDTKAAFDPKLSLSKRVQVKGTERGYDICIFAANGAADGGLSGDHILLMPPYVVQPADVEEIVRRVKLVVDQVFEDVQLPMSKQ